MGGRRREISTVPAHMRVGEPTGLPLPSQPTLFLSAPKYSACECQFFGQRFRFPSIGLLKMLRYKLKELIADQEFRERRRVTVQELAQATGITRNTLSKMLNQHGASVRSENLARLCAYFNCRIEQLLEYVPDVAVSETSSNHDARSTSQ